MTRHPIPEEALDADIATLAKKGAGKTYLNKGLVERLLDCDKALLDAVRRQAEERERAA